MDGFTNPVGTGECWTCVCFGCGGVEWVGCLEQGLEGWGYVCVSCKSGLSVDARSRYLCIVLGRYLRI